MKGHSKVELGLSEFSDAVPAAPVSSLLAGDSCCWQNLCVEWNQSCVFNNVTDAR